jgi:hypothetical protein
MYLHFNWQLVTKVALTPSAVLLALPRSLVLHILCAVIAAATLVSIMHQTYAACQLLLAHLHLHPGRQSAWGKLQAAADVMLGSGESARRLSCKQCATGTLVKAQPQVGGAGMIPTIDRAV